MCLYFQLISTITGCFWVKWCVNLCKLSIFVGTPASGSIYPAAALSSPVVSSNDTSLYWAAPSGKQSWDTAAKNTLSSLFLKPLKSWRKIAQRVLAFDATCVREQLSPRCQDQSRLRLTRIWQTSSRLSTRRGRWDHTTPASSSSHRLPVNFRADLKFRR